jgi:hypothetical protein
MSDEERYAAAWRDRRRRFLVFKTVQIAGAGIVLGTLSLGTIHLLSPQQAIVAFPAFFIVYGVAGVWLNRFRCPRCGRLYYWSLKLKGAFERQKNWRDCHHCGLHQDALPNSPTNWEPFSN